MIVQSNVKLCYACGMCSRYDGNSSLYDYVCKLHPSLPFSSPLVRDSQYYPGTSPSILRSRHNAQGPNVVKTRLSCKTLSMSRASTVRVWRSITRLAYSTLSPLSRSLDISFLSLVVLRARTWRGYAHSPKVTNQTVHTLRQRCRLLRRREQCRRRDERTCRSLAIHVA